VIGRCCRRSACRTPAGRWSVVAPCCRDLGGRTGVHRIAALDEPAAAAGGSKVIKLKEHAGIDRRAPSAVKILFSTISG
jgi:hypothetical protein